MTRSLRLMILPMVLLAAACGSSDETKVTDGGSGGSSGGVATRIPADGDVTGWTVVATSKYSGATCASHSATGAVDCIDGSADIFIQKGATAFAGQQYSNGTMGLELWVFEFASASAASGMVTFLPTCGVDCGNLYDGTWDPVTGVGDGAVVQDTGGSWWLIGSTGKYYFSGKLRDSTSPGATIASEKTDLVNFTKALVTKLGS